MASDISQLIKTAPERIIIGTGSSGRLQVDEKLLAQFRFMGIQSDIHPCNEAVQLYNQIIATHPPTGACFHLTC